MRQSVTKILCRGGERFIPKAGRRAKTRSRPRWGRGKHIRHFRHSRGVWVDPRRIPDGKRPDYGAAPAGQLLIIAGAANGHTVLLLHGRNFPASYWAPVIAALTQTGFRVIAPDQIGFGKSSKPEGPWSFDTAAAQTAALLDSLGIAQVDVIGHSMGGMLAARFTRTYPDRVRRLVL